MTVKEIVLQYLKKNNFGGLYDSDNDCGCELYDLIGCGNTCETCKPGYKHKCSQCNIDYFISPESIYVDAICPNCGAPGKAFE